MPGLYSWSLIAVCEAQHTSFVRIRKLMSRLKISAISYLNTAPLLWDFEHGEEGSAFDLSYTIPSGCAEALRAGTADIGIIPAAAYTTVPDLVVIPDVAIASKRAVRSILLVSEKPTEQVRSVATDTSSMTSVALAKILFAKWLGGPRKYVSMPPNLNAMLAACDAALLIGDPALQVDRSRYVTLDLAEEWNARTAKAFVFAFWAIRKPSLAGYDRRAVAGAFMRSREHGLEAKNLESIVQEWAPRLSLSAQAVHSYFSDNIHYYLDEPCLEGLQLFYRYAAEIGVLPPSPPLNFV